MQVGTEKAPTERRQRFCENVPSRTTQIYIEQQTTKKKRSGQAGETGRGAGGGKLFFCFFPIACWLAGLLGRFLRTRKTLLFYLQQRTLQSKP
jgi:hypothetical protein